MSYVCQFNVRNMKLILTDSRCIDSKL